MYKIVREHSIKRLEERVQHYLSLGYVTQGGVSVVRQGMTEVFYQAMVKYEV